MRTERRLFYMSEHVGDEEVFAQTGQPGSQGSGLGGAMETGPHAGSGLGGPEVEPAIAVPGEGRGPGGPTGSQDSSEGDLAEAGE